MNEFCCLCEREVLVNGTFQTVFQNTHRRVVVEGKGGRAHVLLRITKEEALAKLNKPEEKFFLVPKKEPIVAAPERPEVLAPLPEGDWLETLMTEDGVV